MKTAEIRLYKSALSQSAPFQGLAASILEGIMHKGLLLEAKAGDVVFYEQVRGGPGLYVVLSGEVEVFRSPVAKTRLSRPRRVHLNLLKSSDCFGEYSLLDGKESSASARAVVNSVLFFLPRGEFQRTIEQDAAVGRTIYRNLLLVLIQRLRQKDKVPKKTGGKQ